MNMSEATLTEPSERNDDTSTSKTETGQDGELLSLPHLQLPYRPDR